MAIFTNRCEIDFLDNHQHLIEEIAKLKLLEFSYLIPGRTLEHLVEGLHQSCNNYKLPITWVALDNKKLVGTFSLRECDLQSHLHFKPWLASVIVVPEKRMMGIGAWLVKEAQNSARAMGYSVLYLFTPDKANWYSKLGWDMIELSKLNSTPITIMHKQLTT